MVLDNMIGEVLGGYLIDRKLGEGGMGEVYLATHRRIAKRVAVKVLQPELCRDPNILARFFNEARATSLIDHPGIVQMIDCDVHPSGRAFLIMEYLRGETLASVLRRIGSFAGDLGSMFALMQQIADAVGAAHSKSIVHRDLKPDNIFLLRRATRGTPVVKVLDFGIAKLAANAGASASKTRTGSLLGTPLYMSPEQCRGAPQIDHRADVYSLGCVLFEMLTGVPPFQREAPGELIIAHVTEPPPPMSSVGASVPRELEELTRRMLAKSPDERPSSMSEVAASLEALSLRLGIPVEGNLTIEEPVELAMMSEPTPGNDLAFASDIATPPPPNGTIMGVAGDTALLPNEQPQRRSVPGGSGTGGRRASAQAGVPNATTETTLGGSSGQVSHGRRSRSQELRPLARKGVPPLVWVVATVVVVGGGVTALLMREDPSLPRHLNDTRAVDTRATEKKGPMDEPPRTVQAERPVPRTAEPERLPPPVEPPNRVTIELEGAPPQLTAVVDGIDSTLPLTFVRDGRSHEVVFHAPGYRDARSIIEATRDQSLRLKLERDDRERDTASQSSRRRRDKDTARDERPRERHKRGGEVRAATADSSSSANGSSGTSPPEQKATTPTTPARRLPAAITDID